MDEDLEKMGSASSIAAALLARIGWERELACPGYRPDSRAGAPVARPLSDQPVSDQSDRDPQAELAALRLEMGDCTRCELHRGRENLVFGEGNARARLVFVGEGPGRDEDLAGRPFVGAAGQLLDRIIEAIGMQRQDVYICNIVKCRPPENRTPLPEECDTCGPFALRQLIAIDPEVVVALGRTATTYLLGSDEPMGRQRGRFHRVRGLKVMPTYHPAYLLRNPSGKRPVWEDMKMVMEALGQPPGHTRRNR